MKSFLQNSPVDHFFANSLCGEPGQLGFVLSAIGSGKSNLLCHLGLHSAALENSILHISLHKPLVRVREQYELLMQDLIEPFEDVQLQKKIERHRLIHAHLFNQGKSAELRQTLTAQIVDEKLQSFLDLLDYKVKVLLIDDMTMTQFDFDGWQNLAQKWQIVIWFATTTGTEIPLGCPYFLLHNAATSTQKVLLELHQKDASSQQMMVCNHNLLIETAHHSNSSTAQEISEYTLFSGAAEGAEAMFGQIASNFGMKEVNFTFDGHHPSRQQNLVHLKESELNSGSISLSYVAKILHRNWERNDNLKKVLQVIWHMVSHSEQIFVIGIIQPDNTVHGGTGWSVELAKRWQKPVWVFDQERGQWYHWDGMEWILDLPRITSKHITGSGTRFLSIQGKQAIMDLFERSFPKD